MQYFNNYYEQIRFWIQYGICFENPNDYHLSGGAYDQGNKKTTALRWEIKANEPCEENQCKSQEEIENFFEKYSIGFFYTQPNYEKSEYGTETLLDSVDYFQRKLNTN